MSGYDIVLFIPAVEQKKREGDPITSSGPTFEDVCAGMGLEDPEGFLHDLQHILDDVYRANGERYDEAIGDDRTLHGLSIWRHSWWRIEEHLSGRHPDVTVARPGNSLTITTAGGLEIKVYRGGSDPSFKLEGYDPGSGSITKRRNVARNKFQQLSLFDRDRIGLGEHAARLGLPVWYIVHYGGPLEGLLGMWVGAPRGRTSGSRYFFTLRLPDFCAERGCGEDGDALGGVSVAPSPGGPSGPSYDQISEPRILIEPSQECGIEEL